ncbi:hypothetical protein BGZ63DRAFT_473041 [Mariannaea sp. PMI_226]|nr:hypothetical protein BGZ63DRAFT_473041 [Mariannaea sp. PMI_226]
MIIRHFISSYYRLLLLPNCHPRFYNGWLREMQDLMTHFQSLYYSVLACAASHLHFIDNSSRMNELALTYYSDAVGALSKFLSKESQLEQHNGLLMSVMMLYLHGSIGGDTYSDIPRHVNAASQILTMRLFRRSMGIGRLFDRLAVESVLFQIFLVTTGLWTDAVGLDYDLDISFWIQAEKLLDQSQFSLGNSTSLNSPVLGIPVSLFRLSLFLRRQYKYLLPRDPMDFEQIRREVEAWEAAVLCNHVIEFAPDGDAPNIEERYYRDASCLYALIASVLLEQLSTHGFNIGPDPLEWRESWQVEKAIAILREHQLDIGWSRCFIGNWPVYTLGFFLSSSEDKSLVQADLERRWEVQKFSLVSRFKEDLEQTWMGDKMRSVIDDGGLLIQYD